jgi:hypothetical protein
MRVAAAVLALLGLAACSWSSTAPLMPASAADMAPLTSGDYFSDDMSYSLSLREGNTLTVRQKDAATSSVAQYTTQVDLVEDGYFLAQSIANSGEKSGQIFYTLVHTQPGGFDEIYLSCSVFDKSYAVGAGAVVELTGDKRCMFSSYKSLLKAARAVVAVVKTDPDVVSVNKYRIK